MKKKVDGISRLLYKQVQERESVKDIAIYNGAQDAIAVSLKYQNIPH